ncbi:2'-5' RNA ligase family protein [Candidatus Parcubacteria bacterium]|nr:2'-5' RNA ligase family protein [Candidatus Parcubacteria bacterium]
MELGRRLPLRFTLGFERYPPHITLYQASFRLDPGSLGSHLQKIEWWPAYSVAVSGLEIFAESFIFADLQSSPELMAMHQSVVCALAPHRAQDEAPAARQSLTGLSIRETENIKQFGYPFCGDAFWPHITLGRTVSRVGRGELDAILAGCPPPRETTFQRLMLYVGGPDGQCDRIVAKREF